jgi:hypothetical protein
MGSTNGICCASRVASPNLMSAFALRHNLSSDRLCIRSSRTMARTGLRMLPTFPSPPLKSRTADFPQYGFKASISDGACRYSDSVKPAPSIPAPPFRLHPSFARSDYEEVACSESTIPGRSRNDEGRVLEFWKCPLPGGGIPSSGAQGCR